MSNFADRAHAKRLSDKPCPTCYSRLDAVYEKGKIVGYACPRHGLLIETKAKPKKK